MSVFRVLLAVISITAVVCGQEPPAATEPPGRGGNEQGGDKGEDSFLSANTDAPELRGQKNENQFAIEVRTGAHPALVTGFEIFTKASPAAGIEIQCEIYLTAKDGKPQTEPARSGTFKIGTVAKFYRANLEPLFIAPNTRFFLSWIAPNKIDHPMLKKGAQSTHYWHEPGKTKWSGPFKTQAWGFRVTSFVHGDEQQRRRLVLSLGGGSAGPDTALPALLHALEHDTLAVRREAATALGMLGARAKPALEALDRAAGAEDKQLAARARAAAAQVRGAATRSGTPTRRPVRRDG